MDDDLSAVSDPGAESRSMLSSI